MELLTIISHTFIVLGVFLMIISAIGVIRFPDFYSRCHPAGKSGTLGQGLVLLGLIIFEGFDAISIKLFLIFFFIMLTNPVVTHAMVRAAFMAGLKPWTKEKK